MTRSTRYPKMFIKNTTGGGQSLLEFALLIPILLLFVFGALDLGRAFFSVIVIQNATRAGAREGITRTNSDRLEKIIEMTKNEAQNGGIIITDGTHGTINMISVTCPHPTPFNPSSSDCTRGSPLRVTVTYPFRLTLDWLLPVEMSFQRYTEMMVP